MEGQGVWPRSKEPKKEGTYKNRHVYCFWYFLKVSIS